MATPPPKFLLPSATFRSPTTIPDQVELRPRIVRHKIEHGHHVRLDPAEEFSIRGIALEPDGHYLPMLGNPDRTSRGDFVMRVQGREAFRGDALALMDSTVMGASLAKDAGLNGSSDVPPDLVGDLAACLTRMDKFQSEERVGSAVGLLIDFIQAHGTTRRGERLLSPVLLSEKDGVEIYIERPMGVTHVVFYGITKHQVR